MPLTTATRRKGERHKARRMMGRTAGRPETTAIAILPEHKHSGENGRAVR